MKNFIELLYIREETHCVIVNRDRRSKNSFCMVVEVWVKADNGIRYSIQRCELVNDPSEMVKGWIDKTRRFGLESYRPYSPGQACETVIDDNVQARLKSVKHLIEQYGIKEFFYSLHVIRKNDLLNLR